MVPADDADDAGGSAPPADDAADAGGSAPHPLDEQLPGAPALHRLPPMPLSDDSSSESSTPLPEVWISNMFSVYSQSVLLQTGAIVR